MLLRTGRHLLGDVGQDDVALHHAEVAAVHRRDRAVPTQMLAAARGFGGAHEAPFIVRQLHVGVVDELGQAAPVGDQEALAGQRDALSRSLGLGIGPELLCQRCKSGLELAAQNGLGAELG